jgi:hypothetical protein
LLGISPITVSVETERQLDYMPRQDHDDGGQIPELGSRGWLSRQR